MANIPTAEEFFEQGGTYPELAIAFAKLHVEAALKAASDVNLENEYICRTGWAHTVNQSRIKSSYPLENIK